MKLNLGCGSRYHAEWINVDFIARHPGVIAHDLRLPLPFGNETADIIYHSHVLEHFEKDTAEVFLRECYRILKKNGIMRVVIPDLEQITRSYLTNLEAALKGDVIAAERYEWTVIELIDQIQRNSSGGEMVKYWNRSPMPAEDFIVRRLGSEVLGYINSGRSPQTMVTASGSILKKVFRKISRIVKALPEKLHSQAYKIGRFRTSGEIHQWMYDAYSLKKLLEKAGFANVQRYVADQSQIGDFNSYLLDVEIDGSVRKPDSLFMEASKI